ncbi:MAG: acetoacetate decarboxylase family protein [Nocardioidaceae bacterium]
MQEHVVLGKSVTMPVVVRDATAATAMFSVGADAAQRMVDYSGLRVLRHRPGRTVVGLVFVRYVDGDLGPYDEFGVCVLVRNHDHAGPETALGNLRDLVVGRAGVLIHRLPVDGEFTLAAGREIWGFPKTLADFDTDLGDRARRVGLRQDGRLVADLRVKRGLPLPAPGSRLALRAYSHLDGVTRYTEWAMDPQGVRSRPGGAELRLGTHSIASELVGLGLPKRALFSTSVANLAMRFGDAEKV